MSACGSGESRERDGRPFHGVAAATSSRLAALPQGGKHPGAGSFIRAGWRKSDHERSYEMRPRSVRARGL